MDLENKSLRDILFLIVKSHGGEIQILFESSVDYFISKVSKKNNEYVNLFASGEGQQNTLNKHT